METAVCDVLRKLNGNEKPDLDVSEGMVLF